MEILEGYPTLREFVLTNVEVIDMKKRLGSGSYGAVQEVGVSNVVCTPSFKLCTVYIDRYRIKIRLAIHCWRFLPIFGSPRDCCNTVVTMLP